MSNFRIGLRIKSLHPYCTDGIIIDKNKDFDRLWLVKCGEFEYWFWEYEISARD